MKEFDCLAKATIQVTDQDKDKVHTYICPVNQDLVNILDLNPQAKIFFQDGLILRRRYITAIIYESASAESRLEFIFGAREENYAEGEIDTVN